MSSDSIHDAVLCAERRGRTPARSIDAAIVTEQAYGCNCQSANGNSATVRHTMFPAYGGNSPRLRNGVTHAPVASAVPSFEVTTLQGWCAAPESAVVAILRKLFRLHPIAYPPTHFIHYFFCDPSRMMDTNRFNFELATRRINPRPCAPVVVLVSSGDMVVCLRDPCSLRNLRLSRETRLPQPSLHFLVF